MTSTRAVLGAAWFPGSMRAIGPLMQAFQTRGWSARVCASQESAGVAGRYGFAAIEMVGSDAGVFRRLLADDVPSIVVTGIAECAPAECAWLREIRHAGIPSLGVLDTWGEYASRLGRASIEEGEYPDVLAVMNEDASRDILRVVRWPSVVAAGNPGLEEFLVSADDTAARRDARVALGAEDGQEVLTFFSQPIVQALGRTIGYTQHDALRVLSKAIPASTALIVAAHPRDDADELRRVAGDRVQILEEYDPAALYAASDLVASCFSACLLEAALALRPTMSIQPGLLGNDRCWAARLGVSESARTEAQVPSVLERARALGRSQPELVRRRDLIRIETGAVDRLIDIAVAMVGRKPVGAIR